MLGHALTGATWHPAQASVSFALLASGQRSWIEFVTKILDQDRAATSLPAREEIATTISSAVTMALA